MPTSPTLSPAWPEPADATASRPNPSPFFRFSRSRFPSPVSPRPMRLAQLRQRLADLGAKPCHQDRVLRAWCGNGALDNRRSRAEDFLPAAVRAALPEFLTEADGLARAVSEHPGGDGSARLLVALADGATVESVLLLREGLCVSTQVGCAVGCRFCMTGRDGLLRQLGSAEIVAQVALARRARPVRRGRPWAGRPPCS